MKHVVAAMPVSGAAVSSVPAIAQNVAPAAASIAAGAASSAVTPICSTPDSQVYPGIGMRF